MVTSYRSRALLFLGVFVAGSVGGVLLDQIHVRWHVLAYAHPDLAGQPWWVAPQFGLAVVAIMVVAFRISGRSVRDGVPLAVDSLAFVAAYFATGLLHRHPWVVLIVLLALWAGLLVIHRDRAPLIAMSIVLVVAGPVYESLLTWTGAFHYTVGHLVLRVPFWLPALYLNAGVLTAAAARAMLAAEDRGVAIA